MPKDLTEKQKKFARHYALNGNATEAYKAAGYSTKGKPETIYRKAIEVMQNGNVSAMIDSLQEKNAERIEKEYNITVDGLTEMAITAYEHAEKDPKGASAMVSAVLAIGRLQGLIVEKKHITNKTDKSEITDAELAAIAAGRSPGASEPETVKASSGSIH